MGVNLKPLIEKNIVSYEIQSINKYTKETIIYKVLTFKCPICGENNEEWTFNGVDTIMDKIVENFNFSDVWTCGSKHTTLEELEESIICEECVQKNKHKENEYDKNGFNKNGLHRNGTVYDVNGFDKNGYNRGGYAKDGYNRQGFDIDGFDRQGYNLQGKHKYKQKKEYNQYNGYEHDNEIYDTESFMIENGYDPINDSIEDMYNID